MTRSSFAAALAVSCLLAALPSAGQTPQAGSLHLDVRERVLDNGLTVLVWERPGAGRIGARVFYRVDIAAERPGTVGLTHMLEHYLFMGSPLVGTTDWETERPHAEAVERIEREVTDERNRNRDCFLQREVFAEVEAECRTALLDSLEAALEEAFQAQHAFARGTDFDWIYQPAGGTGLTASTGRDWMKFDIDLPASRLELFMWLERSRVEDPVFRFFEPEREVVVDQIRRADNRPEGPFLRVLRSMTYDAHPYGWAHWFSDLTRATREDHWEIFHKYFIPQNTVIVVVGEVVAEEVFRLAEAYWGSWLPGRPSPRLRTVEPPPVGEKRLTVEAPAGPSVVLHVPMPAVGHDDTPAFEVLAAILTGDRGLLAEELVEGSGVAVSASASAWVARYPSHFTVRVDVRDNEGLEAAESGIDDVLQRLAAGDAEESRLGAARERMMLDLAGSLERIGPAAVRIGSMEATYRWDHLNALPALWASVTAEDLARVAARYFAPEMRTVGHLRRVGAGDRTAVQPPAVFGEIRAPLVGGPVEEWAFRSESPRASAPRGAGPRAPVPAGPSPGDGAGPAGLRLSSPGPLPVAEQSWYVPPWMAERRPARFTEPPPVPHWRDIPLSPEAPQLPSPADHIREPGHGLRIVVVEDALLPLARITALVDARTLDDPAGQEGLADLTARVVRLGGTGTLGPGGLEARLNELGATLGHSVDHDRTRFHLLLPPESAREGARLLASLLGRPSLPVATVEAERDRRAVAAERALDDAQARLRTLFHATLLGEGHPMGRIPTSGTLERIETEDVEAFHRAYYRAERVVFAVSGRVEEGDVLGAILEGWGDATPPGPPPAPPEAAPPPSRDGLRVVTQDVPTRQAHVMFGHEGILDFPSDHVALEVLNYILVGGSFVSRYMELLRTETGITSAVYGSVEPGRDVPFPYVWRFSGNPETLVEGIRLAIDEMIRIREEGVTDEELEGARTSYIQGLIPSAYETSHGAAERMAENALFGRYLYRSPGYLNYYAGDETQIDALRRLSADDVHAAARTYLNPERLVIAVVGPLDEIVGLEGLRQLRTAP